MKKSICIPQLFLALLLTAFCLLPTDLNAQTTHDFRGGEVVIPVGAAPPGPIQFKNRSRTDFYDFTIVIESQNGTALNFSIDTVTIDGKTYNETHNTGSFVRIEADTNSNGTYKPGDRIPRNNGTTRTIRVTLTSHPTVPYNIRIQPTSNTASAVMVSATGQNFGPCGTYMTQFPLEAVQANTYQGLEFGEVNTTAIELTQMHLTPQGPFFIMDAFLLDAQGLPMPGSIYSPSGGMLIFPQPVLPGDTFGIQMIPSALLPNQPMMVQACLGLPPFEEPFFQISGIDQVVFGSGTNATPTTRGNFRFEYLTPMTHGEKFLNILYQPIYLGDTNIYWIGQNITLDHFTDTMEMSMGFEMLPGADSLPTSALPLCNLSVVISDTIYRAPNHFGTPFFSPYTFQPQVDNYGFTVTNTLPLSVWTPPLASIWETWENKKAEGMECNMVNHDLDASNHPGGNGANDYAGDINACGPVATTNSFSWLRKIHPDIDQKLAAAFGPQGAASERAMLTEFSKMMKRTHNSTTSNSNFIKAKLEFIDKYKLPMKVSYQTVPPSPGNPDVDSPNDCYGHKAKNESLTPPNPAPLGGIHPEWIYDRVKEKCDTEILVQYGDYDPLTKRMIMRKGHFVTVTKMGKIFGNWYIRWKDDQDQANADPRKLRHGLSNIVEGDEGLLWLPMEDVDHPEWGKCYITDVFAECYDSNVTFNAVKGRAFEDANGNNLQDPGDPGVEGATVKLVDSNSGLVVGEAKTDEEGNYLFHDLPPGDYHVAFTDLPPGYDRSAKDVGADDEIDSDFNPLGVSDQFTLNGSPKDHLDAGLIPNRIIRILPKTFLQIALDPATLEMLPLLDNQELLPETEPFTAMGLSLMAYRYDSLERYKFTVKPIDWIVIELRDGNDSTIILGALPAVILPDGTIVGANGKPLTFYDIPHGNFFVVIRPRNGLALMTNFSIFMDHDPTQIDFSSPSLPVYGVDSRTLVGGKMAITSGDGNSDGVINAADRSGTWNFRNAVGYLPWDINFDGVVNAADRSQAWNNRNKQAELPE